MPTPQSYKSHTRRDPMLLLILLTFLVNLILAITYTIHQWPTHSRSHLWWIVMAFAFVGLAFVIRGYATKNQDRIIRLEERVRIATLMTPAGAAAAQALTIRQLVALRFASDAELPALVQRTLTENLEPKAIKQAITTWRPDYDRV